MPNKGQKIDYPTGRISHKGHTHPAVGYWRQKCREQIEATGKPLTATEARAMRTRPKRRQRVTAATTPENSAVVAVPEEQPVPHRNSTGQFSRDTLAEWQQLLDTLESAVEFLGQQGAQPITASVTLQLERRVAVAEYDPETGWSVEVG